MQRIAAILAACLLASVSVTPTGAGQFGTGFAIGPKGYLVTCHHVVRNAERIVVHIKGGYLEASIVALDPSNDLAILKVEQWPGGWLGLAPSSEITYGSGVLAAGFPDPGVLGINPKISTGIVNALSGVRDDPRHIQISAPVQPGNSGGPLVSSSGRVVGVVAAGLNSIDRMAHGGYLPQTVNYAVKTDLLLPLLKSASVPLPKFGSRTSDSPKQIERTIGAIALIESLGRSERISVPSRPVAPAATAPAASTRGPWVFPDSSTRALSVTEVHALPREGLWRARNEIYVRHGFIFPTAEGRRFAAQFGPRYRPATRSVEEVQRRLSPVEVANLRLIAGHE